MILSLSEWILKVEDSEEYDLTSDVNHLKFMTYLQLSRADAVKKELSSRLTDLVNMN